MLRRAGLRSWLQPSAVPGPRTGPLPQLCFTRKREATLTFAPGGDLWGKACCATPDTQPAPSDYSPPLLLLVLKLGGTVTPSLHLLLGHF